jgi:hypothetical protein
VVRPGEHETLKAAVHGASGLLMTVCAIYNMAAWRARREPHLAFNAVAYTVLACWEAVHVWHHAGRSEHGESTDVEPQDLRR